MSSGPGLEIYKTLWGVDEPMHTFLPALTDRGFDGVEACLFHISKESKTLLKEWVDANKLKVVCLILTGIELSNMFGNSTVAEHLASLETQLIDTLQYKPVKINIHGGVDSWEWEQVCEYFNGFLALETKYNAIRARAGEPPLILMHETHRGRILYAPWSTYKVMKAFPSITYTVT